MGKTVGGGSGLPPPVYTVSFISHTVMGISRVVMGINLHAVSLSNAGLRSVFSRSHLHMLAHGSLSSWYTVCMSDTV